MVHGVAGSTVDNGAVGGILAVVNEDGPDVDEHKESNVGKLLQREEEGEDVVWQGLRVSIKWVECVRRERGRHNPLVVRLVKCLVNHWVVQSTVDPVDEEIGESDEEGELQDGVPATHVPCRGFRKLVVDERETADFGDEPWRGEQGNDGHCAHSLVDFHAHLVLEVFGVVHGRLVEDEDV